MAVSALPPAHLIVMSLVGWLKEGGGGSFCLQRVVFIASRLQLNSRSGAGSFLIRGKVHRVQSEAA